MSASSKKKLRKEQDAAKLTEKQLNERKEAKKLKIYTTIFVVVLALLVVAALWFGISRTVTGSGIRERNTAAVTFTNGSITESSEPVNVTGIHELNNAELNYFYIDAINQFYTNYGSYAAMFGLDLTKPLNEQVTNEETGDTWADDFLASAQDTAKSYYALADEAAKNGYTLSESEQATVDNQMSSLLLSAYSAGYSKVGDYLKAYYGNGATEESFREYLELNYLAQSYYNNYAASLTYDEAALREADEADPNAYSAYSYNSYYLNTSKFLEGGTTDEDGNTTYSDEEKAASVEAAKATAEALAENATIEELDAAIAALEINAEAANAASTTYTDAAYSNISSVVREWVTDNSRASGDVTVIANTSTTTAEDGTETTTTNGYYVVYFVERNDNTFALANVRHILVAFEGGTTDSSGNKTYSEEEKQAANTKALKLLAQWQDGDATEESFAALANEESADGNGTTGGLYENVYPGQMVTNFNDWCFDESRKAGDTGIVESEYGYHVMYYVGDSETNYRDYLIRNDLVSEDTAAWYSALVDAMTVTEQDTKYISKDLVLSSGN